MKNEELEEENQRLVHIPKIIVRSGISSGDGATCLLERYVNNRYISNLTRTIFFGNFYKEKYISDAASAKYYFVDISGAERFNSMVMKSSVCSQADAAVIIIYSGRLLRDDFDTKTIDERIAMMIPFLNKSSAEVTSPIYFVITKAEEHCIKFDNKNLVELKKKYPDYPVFITSAKTGEGVNEAFDEITKITLQAYLNNFHQRSDDDDDIFSLEKKPVDILSNDEDAPKNDEGFFSNALRWFMKGDEKLEEASLKSPSAHESLPSTISAENNNATVSSSLSSSATTINAEQSTLLRNLSVEEAKGVELFLKFQQQEFNGRTITNGLKTLIQAEEKTLVLQKELSIQAPQIVQRLDQYSVLQRHKGAIEADADLNQYYETMKSQLQQNFLAVMALNTGEIQLSTDMVDIAIQVCAVASGKYIPIAGILVDVLEKSATSVHALERFRYINNLHQLITTLDKIEIYSECLAIECTFYKRKQINEAAATQDESISGQLSGFFQDVFQGKVERKYLLYKLRTGHNPNAVEKVAIIDAFQLLIVMMSGEVKPGQGDKPIMTQLLKKLLGDEYQNIALITIAKPSPEKNDNATASSFVSREEFEALKKQLQEKNIKPSQSHIETVVDNGNGSSSVMVSTQALISTPIGTMPVSDAICWLMQQQANHDAHIQQSTHLLAHYAEQQGIVIQDSDKERKTAAQNKEQLFGQGKDNEGQNNGFYSFNM